MLEIKIEGLGEIQDVLKRFPAEIKTAVQRVLEYETVQIAERARQLAPVRTGALRASIYTVTRDFLSVALGAAVYYAGFVEYGTRKMAARPYLRPAIEEKRQELLEKTGEAIASAFSQL